MKYVEQRFLSCRGAVDCAPPESLPEGETLLVGEAPVYYWDEDHRSTGCDSCDLRPAFHNGTRAWVLRKTWSPAYGYSAYGVEEVIIPFEKGVRILIERGVFSFPLP